MKNDYSSIKYFRELGFAKLGILREKKKIEELRNLINTKRPLKKSIFYSSHREFLQKGRWIKYAPGDGHNFLEHLDIGFIEKNKTFVKSAEKLLGKDYTVIKKSIIRSVSSKYLPNEIKKYIKDIGRPNLNPFIRDDFQDVQHFYYTDIIRQNKT